MLDQAHKEKYEKVWQFGDYRLGSTALRMIDLILSVIPDGVTINDYGSGTGRLEVAIYQTRPFSNINMIDIAESAREEEVCAILALPDSPLKFYLADLQDLSEIPHADWGLCINTLMVVQPENLDTILKEIRRTCDNLIMEAYDFDDAIRLGMQLTTVKKNGMEWMETLKAYWNNVEFIQSPESKQRYIYVCRS